MPLGQSCIWLEVSDKNREEPNEGLFGRFSPEVMHVNNAKRMPMSLQLPSRHRDACFRSMTPHFGSCVDST